MQQSINICRHSYSHLLAQAVQRVIDPFVKLGIGPAIENGFYYDFIFSAQNKIGEDNLAELEIEISKIIKEKQQFIKLELPIHQAKELLQQLEQLYKIELITNLASEGHQKISFYINTVSTKYKEKLIQNVNPEYLKYYDNINKLLDAYLDLTDRYIVFIDMCSGPHIDSTNEIDSKAIKISSLAGAYWKGDEKNIMMSRIYAYAFEDKETLKKYLNFLEEAKKRDHRILGPKLGLYIIDQDVGLGLPLWKPNGAFIVNKIKRWFEDEQLKRGYIPVLTPHIGRKKLWETSGHWGFYNNGMYPPIELGQTLADYQDNRRPTETEIYLLKPMNCPFHIKIFNSDIHSYKELPIKYYEFGTVYRYEKKGELGGLTRVRGFTQDDAHLICRQDQLEEEFKKTVDFSYFVLETFGYKIHAYLSLMDPNNPQKYLGDEKMWNIAQDTIRKILDKKGINYVTEVGEAAFYGPKLDLKVEDSLGRKWQLSTIQFDFNLAEKFEVNYINEKGEKERPFIIHRALLGSLERFMGILIEHYEGAFPFWLAPVQVKIIPVSDKFIKQCTDISDKLLQGNMRVEIDKTDNTFNKKIRNAELIKVPYIFIIGEKEINENKIAIREYQTKKQYSLSLDDFMKINKN